MKISELSKIFILALMIVLVGVPAGANTDSAKMQKDKMTEVKDVESLLDKKSDYHDKHVSVTGEVEDILDDRTFILESGGMFNDEIIVFLDKGTSASEIKNLIKDDAKLTVDGTFKRFSVRDVEREQGWDFKSDLEDKFKNADSYILGSQLREQLSE